MLSKKAYELIAGAIRESGINRGDRAFAHITSVLIQVFTKDNPRFDAWKFMQAVYKKEE